jgi:hypothetical protein
MIEDDAVRVMSSWLRGDWAEALAARRTSATSERM